MLSENQLNLETQSTVFDKLLSPIQEKVEQESERLSFHPREKLNFANFFRLLAFYFVSDIPSLSLLVNTYIQNELVSGELKLPKVGYSTVKDGFSRYSAELFKTIFMTLLSTLQLKSIPELSALGVLYCVDGSLFPTLVTMMWAEYKQNSRAIRLHMCFELNRMIPVNIVVGSGKSSERAALRKMLVAEVTFIADRGYLCFQLFDDILKAQANLIFRVKSNLLYTIKESLAVKLPESLKGIFQNVTDQFIICKNDPHKNTYRLICFNVAKESFYIITNRSDLTTFQVIMLYAYRWQIELMFRFLKRTMNGIHLINNSENGVTIQFYMMLIVALLQLKLKQELTIMKEQENVANNDNNLKENTETTDSTQPINTTCQQDISHPYHFFEIIGHKLKGYWKIGIHWLTKLRSILHNPFDHRAIEILGGG